MVMVTQTAPQGVVSGGPDTTRRYLARLELDADYSSLQGIAPGGDRREQAVARMRDAERRVAEQVVPQLDRMRAAGLVESWEFIPLTGAMLLTTSETHAADAWRAIRGVREFGYIIRDRPMRVRDPIEVKEPLAGLVPTPVEGDMAWQVEKVRAPEAWAQGATGRGVTIGFVDSGANPAHPALAGRYRGARDDGSLDDDHNFFDAMQGQRSLYDGWGHGTNTTSVALGGEPGHQVGVAPEADFISARVFGGGESSLSTMLRGMAWMLAPTKADGSNPDPRSAPDIVNMSFGSSEEQARMYREVIRAYEAAGIVTVAAAGNGGRRGHGSILMPASFPETIAVGFTDRDDRVDERSAHGDAHPDDAGGVRPKPDVVAPGSHVIAALRDGGYAELDGSSLSSSLVSGIAALLLSRYPGLTPAQVRESLRAGAVDVGAPGTDPVAGAGRVDAVRSLEHAASLVAPRAADSGTQGLA